MSSLQDIKDQIGRPKTVHMRENELAGKLSSKKDWFNFLENHLYVKSIPITYFDKFFLPLFIIL